MNIALVVLALLLVILGIVGSIIPGLPGPPLSWLGILLLGFTSFADYSVLYLAVTGVVAAVITVMDFVIPSLSTKRHGGGKAGIWGCNIGLIISLIGLPFGPQGLLGVIFWPFVGAFIGEMLSCKEWKKALRAAWGAFLGFLTGTLLKLVYAFFAAIVVVHDLFL